jgi:hypothetical protein
MKRGPHKARPMIVNNRIAGTRITVWDAYGQNIRNRLDGSVCSLSCARSSTCIPATHRPYSRLK